MYLRDPQRFTLGSLLTCVPDSLSRYTGSSRPLSPSTIDVSTRTLPIEQVADKVPVERAGIRTYDPRSWPGPPLFLALFPVLLFSMTLCFLFLVSLGWSCEKDVGKSDLTFAEIVILWSLCETVEWKVCLVQGNWELTAPICLSVCLLIRLRLALMRKLLNWWFLIERAKIDNKWTLYFC